ncbi:hypothetical protein, partial [Salmonella sp. s37812]|uniref:hypothetical protein n=1 Tax=Salmonella sp. s37812 TaxID=3159642 RepID=UPI00397F2381
ALPLGTFAGLTGLKYLYLGRMSLGSLPAGLFDDVKKLQILGLGDQGRGFTELPDGLFEGLHRLRRLVVNANGIKSLPAGIFSTNTRLSFLNLSDNPITSLPETIFNGLALLHTIFVTQSNKPGDEDDVPRLR